MIANLVENTESCAGEINVLNLFRILFRGHVADQAVKYMTAILKRGGEVVIPDTDGHGIRLQTDQCWTRITEIAKDVCRDLPPTSCIVLGLFDMHRSALNYQTEDGKTADVKLYSRLHTQHKANFDHISKKIFESCTEKHGPCASS